ncbi:efflux transporter outer membrane subunit [Pedobacter frigidisoli]|uniref:TolC family protein n=1 Tax=Pedobacter frigidisoli TaxID=2530455 RepID=UPI0029317F79|nr:efflux transporter outer membrane subunit [Pedobacter frigidisoli]
MKLNQIKNIYYYLFSAALLLLAACNPVKRVTLPETVKLPEKFNTMVPVPEEALRWKSIFTQKELDTLISGALKNNLDMKSGIQRVLIAGANLKLSKAALFPALRASVSGGLDQFGKYTMNGVGNYDTNFSENINADQKIPGPTPDYFAGFRSSWEIDIWGKLSKRKEAAYHRYLSSTKGLKWYQTQLTCQVASLYYELVALDKRLKILKENISLQNKGLEVVEAQMTGGRATALAVSQFKAQRTATQGKQFEIRQAITRVENQLNLLLGRYPAKIRRDTSAINLPLPKKVYAGLPSGILLNRPDVQQAEEELKAAKADVAAARKAFLPSLTLDAYAGYNAFKLTLLFSPGSLAAGFLGGLTAPVLNRAGLKNANLVANAHQLNAFYQYQQSLINGYQEVTMQLSALENYKQAYDYKTSEVAELKNAVSTANDLYLAGYASYLDVIVAQGSVLNVEMEQVDLKQASYAALIGLYRALGG